MKQREKNGQSTGSLMGAYKNLEDKLWKNEELKKSEGALPRLKECGLEKVSKTVHSKDKGRGPSGCDKRKREEKSWSSW